MKFRDEKYLRMNYPNKEQRLKYLFKGLREDFLKDLENNVRFLKPEVLEAILEQEDLYISTLLYKLKELNAENYLNLSREVKLKVWRKSKNIDHFFIDFDIYWDENITDIAFTTVRIYIDSDGNFNIKDMKIEFHDNLEYRHLIDFYKNLKSKDTKNEIIKDDKIINYNLYANELLKYKFYD